MPILKRLQCKELRLSRSLTPPLFVYVGEALVLLHRRRGKFLAGVNLQGGPSRSSWHVPKETFALWPGEHLSSGALTLLMSNNIYNRMA